MVAGSALSGTSSLVVLLLAVFGATAVEMVEALTIVVAVGATRGWRCALGGAGAALGVLAVAVGAGGVPLVRFAPIDGLRMAVGALLLLLGLGWLRKAVLRAAGLLGCRDEDGVYAATVSMLSTPGGSASGGHGGAHGGDGTATAARGAGFTEGFGVAFKGVLLEGVEVVVIVISLGAGQHRLGEATAAAAAAALVVGAAGLAVARQLSGVPENLLKLVVGVMLSAFGTFWMGEGAGAHWPGSDASLPLLVAVFALATVALVRWLRPATPAAAPAEREEVPA